MGREAGLCEQARGLLESMDMQEGMKASMIEKRSSFSRNGARRQEFVGDARRGGHGGDNSLARRKKEDDKRRHKPFVKALAFP